MDEVDGMAGNEDRGGLTVRTASFVIYCSKILHITKPLECSVGDLFLLMPLLIISVFCYSDTFVHTNVE